ncbi:hypothetical protein CAEBREN_16867 [Caenorhabditis brenneri]|uniref:Uncharacterized protein n=1 Tax=Caenorhabditis brenneri TaxID=135651 RepID=G0MLT7_CAEBE|nr:hypothetical protein CAEBREN_16867 [Caenorhabditis brenneri]
MSSTIPTTAVTPMLNAFRGIVADLKSSINLECGLKQLVMMRFNLPMATESGLKILLENIPTTDDENLDRLKNIVIGKVECMEYVDDAKKENALKTKKRPATDDLEILEPIAKRPCPTVAPVQKKPVAQPPMKIDDDFFCRKRTAPMKTAPKPKVPLMPIQPITSAVAASRSQSTTNSLDLMNKCKEIRLAKLEKQKIVNQQKVQDNMSWLESFKMQRIKEQQDRNNGIMPKIDKKNRRMF